MTRTGLDTITSAFNIIKHALGVAGLRGPAGRLALVFCACLSAASGAHAQNVQFTQGAAGAGLDNSIQIPIAAYPGRGAASLPVTLYYSSTVWKIAYLKTVHMNSSAPRSVAEAVFAEHSNAGWTTSLDIPKVEWPKQNDLYWYDGKPYYRSLPPYTFRVPVVYIHMPDGSTHELRRTDQFYEDAGSVSVTGVFYAVDGSRMRYDSTGAGSGTLYTQDGARYVLNGADAQFIDRNGNTLNYNGSTRQWTDTLGALRGAISAPWPASPQAGVNYSYTPPGFSSAYVFKWKSLSNALTPDALGQTPSLQPISDSYLPNPAATPSDQNGGNFPQPASTPSLFISDSDPDSENAELTYANVVGRGQTQGQVFNPPVLAEVVLPNGLSYKFTYNVYGEIDKVVYPTGAYERSQYGTVIAPGNIKPPYNEASRGVKFRWVSPNGTGGSDESQWKYETAGVSSNAYVVKTTAPDGAYAESYRHSFYSVTGKTFGYQDERNGLAYDERLYDKEPAQGGVMLRRTLTKWTQTSVPHTGPSPTSSTQSSPFTEMRNSRPEKSVSLTLDTGGAALAKLVTYQYGASDPANASVIETTTGLDQTGMTESHYADNIDQTTAQTGSIDTIANNYSYPAASSSETVYFSDQSYRNRNILGLTSSVVLKDGAGQVVSKTETFYDETASFPLITYGDLVGDAGYNDPGAGVPRGNATTVRRYTNVTTGAYIDTHEQFDQCGNPVYSWDARAVAPFTASNAVTTKDYSSTYKHAYLTQTASIAPDPSGQHGSATAFAAQSTYEAATGLLLTTTDINGRQTAVSYSEQGVRDPLNRPRLVTRPDGGFTKTSYNDVAGNLYVHTETTFDATTNTHAYQFYDKMGRACRAFALESGLTYIVSETRYDLMGRVSQTSNPFRANVSGTGDPSQAAYWATAEPSYWTTNAYDTLGRVKQVTLPDSTQVTTDYTGVYTTVTDQSGRTRRQKTDALGRVVRVDETDASGNLGGAGSPVQPSFYEYDTLGNVVRVNQGLAQQGANPEAAASYTQHRYFKYDSASRLTYEKQAEQAGTITTAADPLTGNSAWSRKLVYDETLGGVSYKGLLTTVEDARHVVTHTYHDLIGRPYQTTYSDGTPTLTRNYDQPRTDAPPAGVQPVTFYNKGRLTEVTTAATATAPLTQQLYDYDLVGRTRRQRQVVDATAYALRYDYNLGGALTSETYPSGRVVNYGYDSAGRALSVGSGSTTYAGQMSYKPFGGLASMTLGNGAAYSMSYDDARLQLSSLTLTQGGVVVQKYEYKYGQVNAATGAVDATKNVGQIARIEGTIGAQKQWQQRLSYDSLGRLSSAGEYRGDNSLQTYLLNYDYDVYGNRYQKQSRNASNPVFQSWVEDGSYSSATNRFTSGVTYDDAGNVTADSRFRARAFQYDANNRQKQSSNLDGTGAVQSVYDGAGQRVATKSAGVVTNVMVYDAAGSLVAEYGGSVFTNGTRYVMGDHQGSTRAVMSGAAVVSRHDHTPFGEEVASGVGMRTTAQGYSQSDGLRQKYAGMETDDATGMSHTLWREYENLSARWTAPDPYGGSMSTALPQSFNRYAYVGNDPVNNVDPLGLMHGADVGWNEAGDGFWGHDLNDMSPHFGGPEAIGEAALAHDRYVKKHLRRPKGKQPLPTQADPPVIVPSPFVTPPFYTAAGQKPGDDESGQQQPTNLPGVDIEEMIVSIEQVYYSSRAEYLAAMRTIWGYFPDFYQVELDIPVNPKNPTMGIALQGTIDRHGRGYIGVGGYLGSPGLNALGGWLTKPNSLKVRSVTPTAAEMEDFLTGPGLGASAGPGMLGGMTVTTTTQGWRGAYQVGGGSPGGSASMLYTWRMP